MAQGGQITWKIDADSTQFDRGLVKASTQAAAFSSSLSAAGKNAGANFARDLGNSFDSVALGLGKIVKVGALGGIALAGGLGLAAKAAFSQVDAVQQATIALNAYEKDTGKVNRTLGELLKFARSDLGVLFNRKELFAAAQGLRIMGDNTDSLVAHTKIMARSVGLGLSTFEGLGNVIQRVGSTGRLYADDLQFLQNAGFKLDSSLSGTHQTFESLFALLDKGIPSDALEGQSNTIRGLTVKLQTAFRGVGEAILGVNSDTGKFIAGGLGSKLVELFSTLRNLMKDPALLKSLRSLGASIGDFATKIIPLLIGGLKFFADNAGTITAGFIALAAAWTVASVAGIILGIVFGPITLGAFALAAGITAAIAVLTFLQLKFGVVSKAIGTIKDLATDLAKGAFTWLKDRVKDLKDAFEDAQGWVEKHREVLKEIAGVITVVLGPAFIRLSAHLIRVGIQFGTTAALALVSGIKMAISAAIAGGAWILHAIAASVAWIIHFTIMTVKAVFTAIVFVIQAAIAGYAWVFNAAKASLAWLIAFPAMILGAVRTALAFIISSAIASAGWIAGATRTALGWAIAFAGMIVGSTLASVAMIRAAIVTGIAWLIALGPIGLIIAAVALVAAGAYLVIKNWDEVKKFFAGLGGFVLKAIGNFGGLLIDAGEALMKGLIKGITNMARLVGDAVKGVVNKAKEWLPGSPAKKGPFSGRGWTPFRGKALVEGFAEGITSATRSATGAAGALSSQVSSALGTTADMSLGVSSMAPSVMGNEVGGVAGQANTYHIGTINIASEVDGERWLQKLTRNQDIVGRGLTPEVKNG